MTKIDGLDALRSLFGSDEALIEHILEHTLFFDRDMVRQQARDIRAQIRTGQAIPARFTSNANYFLQHAVKTTTPRFKNKSEAVRLSTNVTPTGISTRRNASSTAKRKSA